MTRRIALVSLADEVFRTQADKDYIAARASYRLDLREQFLWAALQACEKYLKGILLFNNCSARFPRRPKPSRGWNRKKEFGHNLVRLAGAVHAIPDLDTAWPKWLPDFLRYLTRFGNNRYLSIPTYAVGDELRVLDETVWNLRRYCQSFSGSVPGVSEARMRRMMIDAVNAPANRKTPALYRPLGAIGGYLENVLKRDNRDFTRQMLVWNNLFFGTGHRSSAKMTFHSSSEIPPQDREWFTPALRRWIRNYVKLP